MVKYKKKDLVKFGNYLLSSARRKSFEADTGKADFLDERLGVVHHADIKNFKQLLRKPKKLST